MQKNAPGTEEEEEEEEEEQKKQAGATGGLWVWWDLMMHPQSHLSVYNNKLLSLVY